MSMAELYYRGRIEEATSFSEVDGIVAEAEDEGWNYYTSIHVAAEHRRQEILDDFLFEQGEAAWEAEGGR